MGGGVKDALHDQMVRDGVRPPTEVSSQPVLAANLIGFLDAFYELDTERTHGEALVRIPWSSIVYYGEYYGFSVDELLFFIRRMDDEHLANLRAKKGSNTDAGHARSSKMVRRPSRPD